MEHYGVKAIKIWPFDPAAQRNQHEFVTHSDIEEGLAPVRKLRDTFGSDIEIMMEFHGGWNLTSAIRIARALEPYQPAWLEDMLLPDNYPQYRQLAEATSLPLTLSERIAGLMRFHEMLEARVAKFVMLDVTWCGGLSEGQELPHWPKLSSFRLRRIRLAGRCYFTLPHTWPPRARICGLWKASKGFTNPIGRK